MSYASMIRELQASRKLETQLALEKHRHEMQRKKVEAELEQLRRSRKDFIDTQIANSRRQYEEKLKEDPQIAEEFKHRHQRQNKERSKIAQEDFQRERQRLISERNAYDKLDKENREVQKQLLNLQTRSKQAQQAEQRAIFELQTKKNSLIRLLQESKKRQIIYLQKAKHLIV